MRNHAADLTTIRVVLVDDHASYRAGLRILLQQERDIVVVGQAGNGDEALAIVAALGDALDVLVLDIDMPGMGGITATRELTARWPRLPILLLTAFAHFAQSGIEAGANGFVLKEQDPDEIIKAIRALHKGGALLHSSAQAQLVKAAQGKRPRLAPRELEVLSALAEGASTRDLQERFALSESAVGRLITIIEAKLDASSRTHAVVIALRQGLIQ